MSGEETQDPLPTSSCLQGSLSAGRTTRFCSIINVKTPSAAAGEPEEAALEPSLENKNQAAGSGVATDLHRRSTSSLIITAKTTTNLKIQVLFDFFFLLYYKKVPAMFYNPIKKTTTVRYKIKYTKTTRCYPAEKKGSKEIWSSTTGNQS